MIKVARVYQEERVLNLDTLRELTMKFINKWRRQQYANSRLLNKVLSISLVTRISQLSIFLPARLKGMGANPLMSLLRVV
jgi:hypothetical protein